MNKPLVIGTHNLDAEIILDFSKRTLCFDYGNTPDGFAINSNKIIVDKETIPRKKAVRFAIYSVIAFEFYLFVAGILTVIMVIATKHKKLAKIGNIQYLYQFCLKNAVKFSRGIYEQVVFGKHNSDTLLFHIPTNLWFNYELDGDYQEKILKISLRRFFVNKIYFGYRSRIQWGWELEFKFLATPQHGYCMVKYV